MPWHDGQQQVADLHWQYLTHELRSGLGRRRPAHVAAGCALLLLLRLNVVLHAVHREREVKERCD